MAASTPICGRPKGEAALDAHGFDLAFGGARRDEERAGPRSGCSPPLGQPSLGAARANELWAAYNARKHKGESLRVFPLSDWTELDAWRYIEAEGIAVCPLYFAAPRPIVERDGLLLMVDDERFALRPGEVPVEHLVRFRTLGCYPLTGAVESTAATVTDIIAELGAATTSERQGRAIDKDRPSAMEMKKQEGYF